MEKKGIVFLVVIGFLSLETIKPTEEPANKKALAIEPFRQLQSAAFDLSEGQRENARADLIEVQPGKDQKKHCCCLPAKTSDCCDVKCLAISFLLSADKLILFGFL